MDINLASPLVEKFIGFASGLGGALVGGMFTIYTTNKTQRSEYQKEIIREEKEVHNILTAMRTELFTLWQFHQRRVGVTIEEMPEGKAMEFYYPLTQDYFTVYHSSAALLGKIRDDDVRQAIVICYNKCKKVVDGFKYNNDMFREYKDLLNLASDSPKLRQRIDAKYQELQEYSKVIKEDHYELKGYIERLVILLNQHEKIAAP